MATDPPDDLELFDLDIKPGDTFSVREKRRMLTLMELDMWSEVGDMLVERAIRGWADRTEREDLLKSPFRKSGASIVLAAAEEMALMVRKERFMYLDEMYMQVALLCEAWRSNRRGE